MMPFLKNGPYDILHCQFGMLGPQVLLWKEIAGWNSKLIVSFRGYDATRYLQNNPSAYKNLFKYGDRFLPVCQYLRTIIIQNGCPIEKTEILRSGIDSHQFSFEEKIEEIQGPASILSVGRLVEKKGFQYALAAIALLINKGKLLRYSIVGEGPLHRELESMIERLGIQAHVQLLGAKKQATVVQLMRCSHILIAPSVVAKNGDQEGIPKVLKEGMAMGLPVVSTYHSGIPELIEDGISGFLVPEHDVASLANRIEFLLDHPQKRIAMGWAGRAFIVANFDHQRLNDQLVECYHNLLSRPSQACAPVATTI
jgi:colanic acid/amylovoran biosynthesis glycosyltransferase